MENYSLADIRAVTGNDTNGLGGSSSFVWIIFLFVLFFAFGGMGNGFGGRGAAADGAYATQADLQRSFNQNAVVNKLDGLTNGLSTTTFELKSSIDACCCATNRNIDSIKQEICGQTYTLSNAIHSEGEATRALINANSMAEKDRQIQTLQNQAIVNAQTTAILEAQGRYVLNPPCNTPYGYTGGYY